MAFGPVSQSIADSTKVNGIDQNLQANLEKFENVYIEKLTALQDYSEVKRLDKVDHYC